MLWKSVDFATKWEKEKKKQRNVEHLSNEYVHTKFIFANCDGLPSTSELHFDGHSISLQTIMQWPQELKTHRSEPLYSTDQLSFWTHKHTHRMYRSCTLHTARETAGVGDMPCVCEKERERKLAGCVRLHTVSGCAVHRCYVAEQFSYASNRHDKPWPMCSIQIEPISI